MRVTEGFVETNGITMHYLDHGGEGRVLLLIPGLTANAHSFDGLVHVGLSDIGRVIALDMRGRGESDAPLYGYAIEDHARDVIGVLDALELDRVVLVGHSFGGLLAYWLAANHPERVERCVAIDAPAEIDPVIIEQVQPSLDRLGHVYPSWDEYLALVQSMPYFAQYGWDADLESYFRADVRVREDGTVQARCRPENIEEVVRGELAVDWMELAARITRPTLLLRAPENFGPPGSPPLLSRDVAERTAAAIPGSTIVEGVGNHITLVFGPGARVVRNAIADFLAVRLEPA